MATENAQRFDHSLAPPTSGSDFHAISFQQGRPKQGEQLSDAVTNIEDALVSLKHDFDLINSIGFAKFTVVGSTDDEECVDEACTRLSLARAELVRDWLIANGAPLENLDEPIGIGNPLPDDYSPSDAERFLVRVVRVSVRPGATQ